MKIIGMEKSSLIDYPGKISTVYFTPGCNFRCPYCHNTSVVKGIGEEIKEEDVLGFIKKRKKFIDAVCISGGEPSLQKDLYNFIKKIKKEEFFIKLDTNGTNPYLLQQLINDKLIDYIAMDIKAPLYKYKFVAGVENKINLDSIERSIEIIKNSKIDYEFRTTLCKELLTIKDIKDIAIILRGSKKYYLQNFRDGDNVMIGKNKLTSYSIEELKEIKKNIEGYFEICEIRGI